MSTNQVQLEGDGGGGGGWGGAIEPCIVGRFKKSTHQTLSIVRKVCSPNHAQVEKNVQQTMHIQFNPVQLQDKMVPIRPLQLEAKGVYQTFHSCKKRLSNEQMSRWKKQVSIKKCASGIFFF